MFSQIGLNWVYTRLTHWGPVTHICVSDLTIIGSDNGLSPGRRQAIIWTNAGLLSIEPLRTYFSENLIKIQPFSLKKMHVKMSSAKWRPFCLGLNVLITHFTGSLYCSLLPIRRYEAGTDPRTMPTTHSVTVYVFSKIADNLGQGHKYRHGI